jgi:hypothetical protein
MQQAETINEQKSRQEMIVKKKEKRQTFKMVFHANFYVAFIFKGGLF